MSKKTEAAAKKITEFAETVVCDTKNLSPEESLEVLAEVEEWLAAQREAIAEDIHRG